MQAEYRVVLCTALARGLIHAQIMMPISGKNNVRLTPNSGGAYKPQSFGVVPLRYCSHINVDTHREAVNGEFVEEPLPV